MYANICRRKLTINHHVDEKYGKLALDAIEELEKERRRRQ